MFLDKSYNSFQSESTIGQNILDIIQLQDFVRVTIVKVCLSNSIKKAKECSLPIFGLLRAIKSVVRCVHLGQLKKLTSIERKLKVLKKPSLKDRADDPSPKKYKISQSNISMKKARS